MIINLLRYLDKYIINTVLYILIITKKKFLKKEKKSNKVLVIRLKGIGDSIYCLPILKTLHKKNYKVYLLTNNSIKKIFENENFIHKIYTFNFKKPLKIIKLLIELNKENIDIIIDTEQFMNISTLFSAIISARLKIGYSHLFRSNFYNTKINYIENKHFIENFYNLLKPLKIIIKNKKLIPLNYSNKDKIKVDLLLNKIKNKKLIGIHIGTAGSALSRRWDLNNFIKLENKLSKNNNYQIIFTGTDFEKELYLKIKNKLSGKQISTINKFNLKEFVYFLSKLNLFISNDTGPMHMAAAMGTKVIGLFGLNNPNKVGAWPLNKNINLYHNPNNNPIINNKYNIYPNKKHSTINLINVDEVLNKVKENLD